MKGLINLKVPAGFGLTRRKAFAYARDLKASAQLIQQARGKASEQEARIKPVSHEFDLLLKLFKAWTSREYKQIPVKTIVIILAALIYFVNPFDVVPDAILGLGYLDDISVISYVIKTVRNELDKFEEWSKTASIDEPIKEGN